MKINLRSFITLSLVAGSLVLHSCGDSKKEGAAAEEQHEMNGNSEEMQAKTEDKIAEFSDATVKQAFEEYLSVKDALVQTDASASKNAAEDLQNTLKETQPEIAEIAGKLAAAGDVNEQREVFSELTAAMDPVLKQAISSGAIYKQYCPMAFEGKGDYWYSTSQEIRNPYFGDKMLKCGRVDETIKK